ncbi:MAG TPA: hypothetical protein VFI37_17270 [Gaiellaceae bacterium]|jgi:hypothetical protein|nr:hypothetical protein [Gaiellaceae bacterium]
MHERIVRFVPLAGVVYAVLSVLGNGSIGDFPDGDTPIAKLAPYYAEHHASIARGGLLLAWSAIFLAFFAVALWTRVRTSASNPLLAGAVLLGAAVAVADELGGAGTYSTLGFLGSKATIAPAALQAWHVQGSGGGALTGEGGLAIMLLAVAAAGIAGRAIPRPLAWAALPLGILQLTPIGFFAGLVFLLWALVTGVVLAVRPGAGAAASVREPQASPAFGRG